MCLRAGRYAEKSNFMPFYLAIKLPKVVSKLDLFYESV